jgi:sodium transport system ATP-binding protein
LFDFFSQLYCITPEVMAERKAKMFERFGVNKFAEVKVANLSTGMKQKLSLVISLVHNPDIIIFDEPTNGLDVLTARTVTDYLQELRGEGKTIILSTHIFSLVERLCDRVGIIIDGRMIACGSLEEMCAGMTMEDRFFEMYKEVKGGEE